MASTTIAWNAGTYVVTGEVNNSDRVTVTGAVSLILCDNATLTASKGITVSGEGNSVTIYAQSDGDTMGKLTAIGIGGTAGIGGENSSGDVVINGGTVEVTEGSSAIDIKNLTVNGGEITAKASGAGCEAIHVGDTLTVNGGRITAISDLGCGIRTKDLNYTGGKLTARSSGSGKDAAGIFLTGAGTLKWTNDTEGECQDELLASSYDVGGDSSASGTFCIPQGVVFATAGDSGSKFSGHYYSGENVSEEDFTALLELKDTTLVPCQGDTGDFKTITFDSAGGPSVAKQIVRNGSKAYQPADPERGMAYVFTGWYKGDAETPYDFDAPVTADLILTAHWRELDIRTEAPSDRMYRPITVDGKTYYAVIPVNGIYAKYVYTGSAIKPEPVVTDINGETLREGGDYTLTYSGDGTILGVHSVTVSSGGGEAPCRAPRRSPTRW